MQGNLNIYDVIFSFLFFMKTTTKEKILLVLLICLGIFILLVNRGKTAHVSFIRCASIFMYGQEQEGIINAIIGMFNRISIPTNTNKTKSNIYSKL